MRLRPSFFPLLILLITMEQGLTQTTTSQTPPNILFLIADDWSYPHAGIYGDKVVQTPTFDLLAKEGALFDNAYCSSPSCSPSRASILTSRYPHQNNEAGNLWSVFSNQHVIWPELLEKAGYHTGKTRKGWAPGDYKVGGFEHNPAGKDYNSLSDFLKDKKKGQPFYFWFGSTDPHRTYKTNTGVRTGMDPNKVIVPGFLPDVSCVRNDILDYYFEIERFDRECGNMIRLLEKEGLLDNTLIVMTSDNGMPFPRAKANLYDYGTRMPLVMYWKGKIVPNTKISEFMNFIDYGPTFLEAAGLDVPKEFSGQSLLPLLMKGDNSSQNRDQVFLERERHANVRKGDLSYPVRAVRNNKFLYIKNFEPDRWPAGDPTVHKSVGQYGDVDNSISKYIVLDSKGKSAEVDYFKLTFDKRPKEELYNIIDDPYQLHNLAADAAHSQTLFNLRNELEIWMKNTDDRRVAQPKTTFWDEAEYTPNYQHQNFDANARLGEYRMLKNESGKYVEYPCQVE